MNKVLKLFTTLLILAIAIFFAVPGITHAEATISSSEYKAGDIVTIEGTISPGQELYIAIAQQKMFATKDTDGITEQKKLKKAAKKNKFSENTAIPPLYYMLTTDTAAFGKEGKKIHRFQPK
mgnify:FL=1